MRELIHIYGPFSIHSYGLAIALGLLIFIWLIQKNPRFIQLKLHDHFASIASVGLFASFAGARLLYMLSESDTRLSLSYFFSFWDGGFSVLGGIIALTVTLPLYLYALKVPILPFTDLVSIYVGIIQGAGRIGCFFAGCCYGLPAQIPWSVCYTNPNTSAPLGIHMHPTQLYSSALFFCIFLFMYFVLQHKVTKPGQLTTLYLMLASSERFIVDFWRADRVFATINTSSILSINQWVALGIFISAILAFVYFTSKQSTHEHI